MYPNGLQSSFTYDNLNRVTAMNAAKASYSYTLNPTGNRTGAVESSGRTLNWSYDGIYRLTNETISLDPHSVNGSVGYGLDPVGNRQSQTSTLSEITSGSYTYDADDRLSTETYDANGNTLVTGARTFTYDFENRLKTMARNGSTVTIAYDGDGNRVSKTANGVTTQYLVDGLNPTGYAQVVEEVVNGAVTRQYTYGMERISQNQLISNAWTPSFYVNDALGNARMLTDSTGTVTDGYDYDAWGNVVNAEGGTPNLYLYRGEQFDSDLDLYYLRARYLDPSTGRFLSRDPAPSFVGSPATLRKYLYADADPIDKLDPTGRTTNGDQGCHAGFLMFTIQPGGYLAFAAGPLRFLADIPALHVDTCGWSSSGYGGGGGGGGWGAQHPMFDPSGPSTGPKCNPCSEPNGLRARLNTVNIYLNNLRRTGHAAGPGSRPGANSVCTHFYHDLARTNWWFSNYHPGDNYIDQRTQPCVHECADVHENVHKYQCEHWGPVFNLPGQELEQELPAYQMERDCLLKRLSQGGFGPHAY